MWRAIIIKRRGSNVRLRYERILKQMNNANNVDILNAIQASNKSVLCRAPWTKKKETKKDLQEEGHRTLFCVLPDSGKRTLNTVQCPSSF